MSFLDRFGLDRLPFGGVGLVTLAIVLGLFEMASGYRIVGQKRGVILSVQETFSLIAGRIPTTKYKYTIRDENDRIWEYTIGQKFSVGQRVITTIAETNGHQGIVFMRRE